MSLMSYCSAPEPQAGLRGAVVITQCSPSNHHGQICFSTILKDQVNIVCLDIFKHSSVDYLKQQQQKKNLKVKCI